MFGSTWLCLKEAQHAFARGRFAEAYRVADGSKLRGHRRARQLADQVRQRLGARWLRLAGDGFPEAAVAEMRYSADVVASDAVLARLDDGLHRWVRARRLTEAGRLPEARTALAEARALLPELGHLPDVLSEASTEAVMNSAAGHEPYRSAHRLSPEVAPTGERLLLWIDGVSGWLVCLGERVRLGQATDESPAEVPILADVSRVHATIERTDGEYVLVAHRPVRRNGKPADRTALVEGDRIGLGTAELAFRRPSPGSLSAQLRLVSRHRLLWAVDGILLWADTLELGPAADSHVVCPEAADQVVLFRQGDGLWCRSRQELEVATRVVDQPYRLELPSQVRAEGISFALEPVR